MSVDLARPPGLAALVLRLPIPMTGEPQPGESHARSVCALHIMQFFAYAKVGSGILSACWPGISGAEAIAHGFQRHHKDEFIHRGPGKSEPFMESGCFLI